MIVDFIRTLVPVVPGFEFLEVVVSYLILVLFSYIAVQLFVSAFLAVFRK